jgi:ABC-2 type transport system ATP-binding protein
VIRVDSLRKSFGSLTAVDGVSFDVQEGEIFGLLGPNGAGKTTTLSMVAGVLEPDGGRVSIGGRDIWQRPKEVKRQLGVVPQEIACWEDLTARDNLVFWASLYDLGGARRREAVDRALERVGLSERAGDRVKTFSGGMKRRLNLAMGLVHEPRFLLLDEPTVGIDPQARLAILEVVREVARGGTTIVYTTHTMGEAETLCDRLAIVDHGRILTTGTLDELIKIAGETELVRLTGPFDDAEMRARLERFEGLRVLSTESRQAVVSPTREGPGLRALLPELLDPELGVEDVSIQRPSLESVFIRLTGRELRD